MSEETEDTAKTEIANAKAAYAEGRFDDAKHHLTLAESAGVSKSKTAEIRSAILKKENSEDVQTAGSGKIGFWIAFVGYLILFFNTPRGWGIPLWIALAFLLIPVLAGFQVGKRVGYDAGTKMRFRRAFRSVGFAMWGYTFLSLILQRTKFPVGGEAPQVLLLWIVIPVLYAAIAGCVAGTASVRLTHRRGRA